MYKKKDFISLFEANSGAINERGFKSALNDLFGVVFKGLKNLDSDDFMSNVVERKRKFLSTFNYECLPDGLLPYYIKKHEILTIFKPKVDDVKNNVYLGADVELNDIGSIITIYYNNSVRVIDLLDKKDVLEASLSHEMVHIFKSLRGEYQKIGNDYLKRNSKSTIDKKKYFSSPSEIDAFITQMNVELKNIKDKNSRIQFVDALKKNNSFLEYIRNLNDSFNIGNFNPIHIKPNEPTKKLKKYILKKLQHYWFEELKGS